MIEWGLALTLGGVVASGLVWGIRLEGRVNQAEALASATNGSTDRRFDDLKRAVERLDRKIDTLLARGV
jgi:hypothetical protein